MRLVILTLLLASSDAQAQMSLRPNDGFEDCPGKAYPQLVVNSWDTSFGPFPHSGVNRINVPFNGSLGLLFFAPQSPLSGQFQGLPRGTEYWRNGDWLIIVSGRLSRAARGLPLRDRHVPNFGLDHRRERHRLPANTGTGLLPEPELRQRNRAWAG